MTLLRLAIGARRALCALTISVLTGASAWAARPDDKTLEALAAKMLAGVPAEPLDVETMQDGLCAQDKLVAILQKKWGKPI